MKKILVIGSANADLAIHTDRMPMLGETVAGNHFSVNAGGKGLNQAVAVAKLGGNASFLGAIGDDANGELLLHSLETYGVAFEGIRIAGTSTGTAVVTVVGGDNFIILNEGANACLTPDIIEQKADLLAAADWVVLQLEIPVETVCAVCKAAKENGAKILLNPAPYKELPQEIYPLIDILVPNEYEAQALTGIALSSHENCMEAVRRIRRLGVKTAVVTLGERGCVYNSGKDILFCAAEKTQVVDTTSAGDAFIGALCSKLADGGELNDAIRYATKVAAVTVSRCGAASSVPYACELAEETDFRRKIHGF
ncbi:MAG: ribokinase [Acutalibacteraceae bacterium]